MNPQEAYQKMRKDLGLDSNSLIQPKNSCYRRDWILIKSMVTCLNHQLMLNRRIMYEVICDRTRSGRGNRRKNHL